MRSVIRLRLLAAEFALCFGFGAILPAPGNAAEPPPEHLYYDVPKDAAKLGPFPNRDGGTSVRYLAAGTKEVLCEEDYTRKGVMVKRKLFRNGKQHGVQREWYKDGGKMQEEPYCDGMMDGIFRHWDEQGRLMGCCRVARGTGLKTVYHPNGLVKEQEPYADGVLDGMLWGLYDNGRMERLAEWRKGKLVSFGFGFQCNDDSMRYVGSFRHDKRHGPYVKFDDAGRLKTLVFSLNDHEVSAEEYRKACETDPTLPQYEDDPQNYRKLLTPAYQDLIANYRKTPPVKLPLEIPAEWKILLPPELGAKPPSTPPPAPAGKTKQPPPNPSAPAGAPGPSAPAASRWALLPIAGVALGGSALLVFALVVLARRRRKL